MAIWNRKLLRRAALCAACLLVTAGVGCKQKPAVATGNTPHAELAAATSEAPLPVEPARPAVTKDFSQSNSVSLLLAEDEQADGLKHNFRERDGLTTVVKVADVPCRFLNRKEQGHAEGYIYFAIDPGFKATNATNVRIDVEYFDVVFDAAPAMLTLQFDASGGSGTLSSAYHRATGSFVLRGSETWRTATFRARGATFANSQNGRSDFRILVKPPELYVRRVTVTRE